MFTSLERFVMISSELLFTLNIDTFTAQISPVLKSIALYTLPKEPCPIKSCNLKLFKLEY